MCFSNDTLYLLTRRLRAGLNQLHFIQLSLFKRELLPHRPKLVDFRTLKDDFEILKFAKPYIAIAIAYFSKILCVKIKNEQKLYNLQFHRVCYKKTKTHATK